MRECPGVFTPIHVPRTAFLLSTFLPTHSFVSSHFVFSEEETNLQYIPFILGRSSKYLT
jgi:hypothetical protein